MITNGNKKYNRNLSVLLKPYHKKQMSAKNKDKKLTPQQMSEEIKRIASFKKGYKWLLSIARKHKYKIKKVNQLPIDTWIEITHEECMKKRNKAIHVFSKNHIYTSHKSKGHAASYKSTGHIAPYKSTGHSVSYSGFIRIIYTPMGGQPKRY